MGERRLFSWLYVGAICSSFSLVVVTSVPCRLAAMTTEDTFQEMADIVAASEDENNTLLDAELDEIGVSPAEQEIEEEEMEPPFEEADSNIEEQNSLPSYGTTLKPDPQKILYDPNMNYGKGAPVPKLAPVTTVKRNLIVLSTSIVLATVAMLVVSTNKGSDAPKH